MDAYERVRQLPAGDPGWIAPSGSPSGGTWAHLAADRGELPAGFDRWDAADDAGITVAHVAAAKGRLPPDFDRWAMATKIGTTVAHVAARHGYLPEGFDQWHLKDGRGEEVVVTALLSDCPPESLKDEGIEEMAYRRFLGTG
jgi:hypothetical protein